MKKLIFITIFFIFYSLNSYANDAHFIDFKKVLNSSKAGSGAQKKLQQEFQAETKKFEKLEKEVRKEEADIILQKKKKELSPEEYKKKVQNLRKKVLDIQKNKKESLTKIAKSRNQAKASLLKAVNPIIKDYMEENKIRIIINKNSVVLGDTTLEITDQIIVILNKKLPSIN